ncbi:MAG TPA: flagellar biosynthetic protein FliO [Kofleriaceae bacterium]|nr:flagellar biosynthetic protein FliO [Kofleriaceae bacterium]
MTRSHRALWFLPAALLSAALLPAAARAGDALPVAVEDRGDHVAVILSGVHTSASRPEGHSDRIELPLDQAPPAIEVRLDDATVRKVELRTVPPSVRVQLRHGTESTRLAAEMAVLYQHGDRLEIVMPREPREVARALRAAAAPPPAAASAAPAAAPPARPIAAPAPAALAPAAATVHAAPAEPAAAPRSAPTAPTAELAPAPAPAPSAAATGAAPPAPAVRAPALDLDRPRPGSGSPLGTALTFGGLAGIAAVAWLYIRRKKSARSLTSPLEILAQVSVGPRARVVWLAAGRREMLISVSEKDVRVLGQWPTDGARTAEPGAHTAAHNHAPARSPTHAPPPADEGGEPRPDLLPSARLRRNPSLSGLIRLRDQHVGADSAHATDGDDGAGLELGEEDTEWARQLVAATRRGALR